jgi:TRAP-type C4-dicarboxylate transport system substrate-binding protein
MKIKNSYISIWLIGAAVCMAAFALFSPNQAQAKSIELSVAMHIPPKAAPYPNAFLPWTQEITKQTDGRVTFKFYLSQTLVKARDAYNGVKNGIADMTWVALSLTTGRFPLTSVIELPYMSPDTFTGAHVLNDLYKKFPEIRAEFNDVHFLFFWVTLPYEIHTNKPVKNPQDVKGMKLATQPGARVALEALGAVPVTMPVPKIYQTVDKGVADGSALAWGAYKAFKIYEVTKYHINPHLSGLAYATIMNKNRWNSLSKQDQDIITRVTSQMMPDTLCAAVTGEMNEGIKISKERGDEIIDLSPEEFAKWQATGKPAWNEWVKQMEAKGLPGQKVLDETIMLVEKYSK